MGFNFGRRARILSLGTGILLKSYSTNPNPNVKNVVIIGSGPAAHTAAIYASRANLSPVLYEGFMAGGIAAGGQLTTTTEVENFPGFPDGILGPDLMENMRKQSLRFGTEIITETVSKVDFSSIPFKLYLEGKETQDPILTKSVIIATGATAKRLFIKALAVIGGGDSACEEALFLTKYASKVFVIVRRDELRASKIMSDRLKAHPKIEILWNNVPIEAKGDGRLLNELSLKNTKTGVVGGLPVNGLFYAIGHVPNTAIFKDASLKLDQDGYILVESGTTQTNITGVFAVGDVVDKRYRQAVTAAGSGCAGALDCERWLSHKL